MLEEPRTLKPRVRCLEGQRGSRAPFASGNRTRDLTAIWRPSVLSNLIKGSADKHDKRKKGQREKTQRASCALAVGRTLDPAASTPTLPPKRSLSTHACSPSRFLPPSPVSDFLNYGKIIIIIIKRIMKFTVWTIFKGAAQ